MFPTDHLPTLTRPVRLLFALMLIVLVPLFQAPIARAATCNPSTATELVTAVNDANAGSCPNNTITLVAGTTYTFATPNYTGDSFSSDSALPRITGTVIIEGNGATVERSSAADTPRFRLVYSSFGSNLTIRNLTLRNGATIDRDGTTFVSSYGGCILAYGSPLTIQTSTLTNCSNGTDGEGSAILIQLGTLLMDRSTIYNNSRRATTTAAITIQENVNSVIRNSTVSGNTDDAIHLVNAALTLINSTVTRSRFGLYGINGTVHVKNSIVAGNGTNVFFAEGFRVDNQGNNVTSGDPGLAPLANNGGSTMTHALLLNVN